jgi:hypothetical protein
VLEIEQIEILEDEFFELAGKYNRLATRYLVGKINIADLERALLSELKGATIRAYFVGANGKPTQKHYGSAGIHLRQRYADIHKLVEKASKGELSEKQFRDRLNRQARTIQTAAARADKITQALNGFDLARRTLDPQAKHCSSCLGYVTDGYVPIEKVVPRGANCECGAHCRCLVTYKKSGDPVNPLTLVEIINKADRELSLSKNELLAQVEKILTGRRRTRFKNPRVQKSLGFGII